MTRDFRLHHHMTPGILHEQKKTIRQDLKKYSKKLAPDYQKVENGVNRYVYILHYILLISRTSATVTCNTT